MYVRENGDMDLVEAIRRSATLPALLLEPFTAAMQRKGRLQVGADADIIAFDPERVSDQATYRESCRPSTGFRHVVVNGVPVIEGGLLDLSAMPGRPIRAD
jgi:N-acyl-D-aspartate/D-glutamate deacylase